MFESCRARQFSKARRGVAASGLFVSGFALPAAIGKWHLTPDDEQGPARPFDRRPKALGHAPHHVSKE